MFIERTNAKKVLLAPAERLDCALFAGTLRSAGARSTTWLRLAFTGMLSYLVVERASEIGIRLAFAWLLVATRRPAVTFYC
jgi:hypothetical protein